LERRAPDRHVEKHLKIRAEAVLGAPMAIPVCAANPPCSRPESVSSGELGEILFIGGRERFAGVEHVQNKFGRASDSRLRRTPSSSNFIARLAQTAVSMNTPAARECWPSPHRVARRAGNRRDNGAIVAEQLVEQAGFARIRTANNRRADAAPENLSFVGRAQQFIHERHAVLQPFEQLLLRIGRNVLVGKINVRLDVRERLHISSRKALMRCDSLPASCSLGGQREFRP